MGVVCNEFYFLFLLILIGTKFLLFRGNKSFEVEDPEACYLCLAVAALNVMYSSMKSPSLLTGWKSGGGDPCGDSWEGIECSGSSVTEMYPPFSNIYQ